MPARVCPRGRAILEPGGVPVRHSPHGLGGPGPCATLPDPMGIGEKALCDSV